MKNIEVVAYTYDQVLTKVKTLVRAAHNELARDEKLHKKRFYETFGEWKKQNQLSPIASKNYPEDEYVIVISAYKKYFDTLAAASLEDDDDELE